ncbi:MAG TPA: N-acetyltransferase [Albitalea sp.]|nr:N-acetyltransferase [Albitalea sp.]
MIDTLRTTVAGGARYDTPFPEAGVTHMTYRWTHDVDATLERQVIDLMRHTTASAPIIGFAEDISDAEAAGYLHDLRAQLAAHKVRLLTIFASTGQLVGLCTLRRNLNPNNRHITDLAKGMIREEFRGGAVLPAAFHEIALQCEADGVEVVTLDVRADTPAYHAWDRFGFQTYGFLPDYARAQGKVHAGHFMMQKVADLKARAVKALEARARKALGAEAQPA